MSTSADQPPRTRSSSNTFLRVLTLISLCLACGEFLLTLHYRRNLDSSSFMARKFQEIYYNSLVWTSTKWQGVTSEQAPTDNWNMQELIVELHPDYVIETGTLYGGTTLFYADVMSSVNPQGKVITIDVEPKVEEASKCPYGSSAWR